jgi:replicative DNA helicase Mcm
VAYVGDSGVGKSKLAKATARIAPTSVYKSADNVTEVGLTAAVTHEERFDTSKWTVSGGALVRADGGHAVIDELDKAPESIQGSLQEPLSEGTVSVSKSKVHAKLYSRCSALIIANPHNGNFDLYQPLSDQIKFNPAVWDRMDIIVPFVNKADEEKDADIADGVFGQITGDDEENLISEEMMQKYIAYARHISPEWDDDAMERIKEEWQSIRASSGDGRVTIGPRQLEAMIRIAEASARTRLSDAVTLEDAENSLDIMKTWMSLLMTDESGAWDIEALSGVTAAQRKPEDEMWRAIKFHDDGDGALREDVIERVMSRTDLDRSEVQQDVINSATGRQDAEQDTNDDGEKVLFDRR